MKYIQSFYQYPVTFSAIGKTIPARSAQGEMRNIAEITDKELVKLQNCEPFFRELVDKKKIRVLNKIPVSYIPPAVQINNARDEADRFKSENETLRARIAELEAKQGTPAKEADAESVETEEAPAEETEVKEEKPVKGKAYRKNK